MMSDYGLLILRLMLGVLFVAHGGQKFFGWFGGAGIQRHSGWLGSMGLRPGWFWAWVNALAEFGGGVLLVLGVLTPVAAAAIASTMVMAIAKVHWPKGFWNNNGGYEFHLLVIAASLAIGLIGPGAFSLAALLPVGISQAELFLASILVGLLGVLVGLAVSGRRPPQVRPRAT